MNKFDETIERILNNEDYGAFGMDVDTVIGIVEDLRHQYAPDVEMTKQQAIIFSKHIGDPKVVTNKSFDYPEDIIMNGLSGKQLAQAWLNPDTIKVINK